MASVSNSSVPQFPPPPTPSVSPPPLAAGPARPPPPPPVFPPPPPRPIRPPPPPPPRPIPPPPPRPIPPPPAPSPPDHHPTVIIVVFVSFGCLLLLAFALVALWCFLKKMKKKAVGQTGIINVDEHLKVKEAIVQGRHGPKRVVLSVDDDVHINGVDTKKSKSLADDAQNMHAISGEIIPTSLEEGRSSSTPSHHHSKQSPI